MKLAHNYYVYIVQCSDGAYYTGVTNNLERRLQQHNDGEDKKCFTHARRPVVLKYAEHFQNVKVAIPYEKQLKGWSRKKKEALFINDIETLKKLAKGCCMNLLNYHSKFMIYKIFLMAFFGLFAARSATAQDFSPYQKKEWRQGSDTLRYRLLLPEGYKASKKYPLILFLHGAGERGRDNEAQLLHGGSLFLNDTVRKSFPAIVVFPQCAANDFWSNVQITPDSGGGRTFAFQEGGTPTRAMAMLENLLEELQRQYKIKSDQMYVMGLSMGGMGTFELVRRHPDLFAAAVPICGGAHPATAGSLKKVKWWVFHGGKDDVVPPQLSEAMVATLKAQAASVKFTVYPEAGHNSWDSAFAEPELLPWLFAQRK